MSTRAQFQDVKLDGRNAIMVADCPSAMADGGWSAGLIFDEDATPEQQQALGAILSGQVGGPMTAYAPWVSKFLGTTTKKIDFVKDGLKPLAVRRGDDRQRCGGRHRT